MTEFDRFTEQGQMAAQLSAEIIQRYGHSQVDTEHLLLALIEQSDRIVSQILVTLNIDTRALTEQIDATLRASPKSNIFGSGVGQIFITPRVKRIIDKANEITNEFHDKAISSEHIFFAILTERDTPAARILERFNLTSERAYTAYQRLLGHQKTPELNTSLTTSNSKEAPKEIQTLQIFLCHSSGDKPRVRELYQRLLKDGMNPWLDEENLLPGYDWQVEIPKSVRNSDAVIVCLSKGSITKKGYVQKEIKYALDAADEQPEGAIFIIPLKLEECDIPERLSRWQWVNLFDEIGYQRLMRSLNILAEKKVSMQDQSKSA